MPLPAFYIGSHASDECQFGRSSKCLQACSGLLLACVILGVSQFPQRRKAAGNPIGSQNIDRLGIDAARYVLKVELIPVWEVQKPLHLQQRAPAGRVPRETSIFNPHAVAVDGFHELLPGHRFLSCVSGWLFGLMVGPERIHAVQSHNETQILRQAVMLPNPGDVECQIHPGCRWIRLHADQINPPEAGLQEVGGNVEPSPFLITDVEQRRTILLQCRVTTPRAI